MHIYVPSRETVLSRPGFGSRAGTMKEDTPLVGEGSKSNDGRQRRLFECSLSVIGPGLLVSLADTDFACLLQAADSGARYGFSALIGLQLLLFPVLFMAQELTVRLGAHTHRGHGACIREHYGNVAAWSTTLLLLGSCMLATISELAGITGAAGLCGFGATSSACVAAALLILLVCVLPYRAVQAVALCFGVFEAAFLVSWYLVHPLADEFWPNLFRFEDTSAFFSYAAANIGAVIMPWMIYFQQSVRQAHAHAHAHETCTPPCASSSSSLLSARAS